MVLFQSVKYVRTAVSETRTKNLNIIIPNYCWNRVFKEIIAMVHQVNNNTPMPSMIQLLSLSHFEVTAQRSNHDYFHDFIYVQ